MSKIYVIQETMKHNLLPAQVFGELVFLLPPNAQITFSPGPTVERLRRNLKHFSGEDFLLLIGDPAAMAIAAAMAAQYNGGKFRLLKWDKREMKYFPIQVDLNQKGESNVH